MDQISRQSDNNYKKKYIFASTNVRWLSLSEIVLRALYSTTEKELSCFHVIQRKPIRVNIARSAAFEINFNNNQPVVLLWRLKLLEGTNCLI